MGTELYIAPEIKTERECNVDFQKADVYSFGVMLFHGFFLIKFDNKESLNNK